MFIYGFIYRFIYRCIYRFICGFIYGFIRRAADLKMRSRSGSMRRCGLGPNLPPQDWGG